MNIYEQIKLLSKEKGNMKIRDLEQHLGFAENTLSKWSKNIPSIDKVVKVANYFNVSLDYFVGRTITPSNIDNSNNIGGNGNIANNSNNSNNSFSPNNNQFGSLSELDKVLLEVTSHLSPMQKIDVVNYAKSLKF